jgi:hypothetical protein
VTGAARLLEELVTVLGQLRRGSSASLGGPGLGLDRERGIVLTGDRYLRERPDLLLDFLDVVGLGENLLVLRLARHHSRQREKDNGDRYQQADNHTEYVEEVGILLAHNVIRVGR